MQKPAGNSADAVASRFSLVAGSYDAAARVQFMVAEKLMEFLGEITPPPHRILDVGCGTGIFTRMISQRFPQSMIEAIDIADSLLGVARERFAGNDLVHCLRGNALTFRSSHPFQLISSSSSFHWMPPFAALFNNMLLNLSTDGLLVFSMMTKGTLSELHDARSRVVPHKAVLSRLPCTPDIADALQRAGLKILRKHEEQIRVTYPTVTDFLYSLHNVGVTGGPVSTSGVPLTRGELSNLLADYVSNYDCGGGQIYATYHVLYAMCCPAGAGAAKKTRREAARAPKR